MTKAITNADDRGIATVTLNNLKSHNAFDDEMISLLTEAFSTIAADSGIRAMVLSSSGKSFCAGANIGSRQARRYFFTGERFSADRAKGINLVSDLVEEHQLDDRIEELLKTILDNSPVAISNAKQLVFDINGKALDRELIDHTSRLIAEVRASDDGREGLSAFLDKRKPTWRKG